jgi:hypothetical protein
MRPLIDFLIRQAAQALTLSHLDCIQVADALNRERQGKKKTKKGASRINLNAPF